MEANTKEKLANTGIKALVVAGVLVVLGLVAWGAVRIVPLAPAAVERTAAAVTTFRAQFVPAFSKEVIKLSLARGTVPSNENMELSWEGGGGPDAGAYTFLYHCRDGVHFETTDGKTVFCNTPFRFLNTQNTLTLTAISKKNRFADVPISIHFTPNSETQATVSGSTLLTIVNKDITNSRGALEARDFSAATEDRDAGEGDSTPPQATAPSAPPRQETQIVGGDAAAPTPTIDPQGLPDLAVRILGVGTIDKDTGVFVATSSVTRRDRTDRAAVRFEVINLGTNISGEWSFSAALPTTPSHTFRPKELQQSLAPGDRIEYTLGFDRLDVGTGTVAVTIDPFRELSEVTRANNRIEATITITRE